MSDWWPSDYTSAMYGGAPDECSIHWPTKLVDGKCPEDNCPHSKEREEDDANER